MAPHLRNDYLATEVFTAAPQKLHLLLIEAALRLASQARDHWLAKEDEQGGECLIRCQQIMTELLCSLRPEHQPDVVKQVSALYTFIFRRLVSAHLEHDAKKLQDAITILEEERETWKQVCAQLGTKRDSSVTDSFADQPRASFVA